MEATAQGNHFFSTNKHLSRKYAGAAARDEGRPAMVRTLGTMRDFHFEHDSDADDSDMEEMSFRTSSDIPSNYVLGSKKSAPGEDAAIFRRELHDVGISLSGGDAGKLLRDVQSDSDSDFSESDELHFSN